MTWPPCWIGTGWSASTGTGATSGAPTPYWGVAQAVAVRPGARQTVMNFAHNKLNQFMPTVTFTDKVMYLRGHNDHNDSRQKKHVKPVALPRLDAEGEAELKARFAIDADHVRRVFA